MPKQATPFVGRHTELEHLLDAVGLFGELLERAPAKLLVTSREPLHLRQEHVYEVAGLAIPGEASEVEAYDGIKLFVQQAQRQQTSFNVNDANRSILITICQLLGGMPLALELAASWLRLLPLDDISNEISKGLDFLEANSRDVPERHRSVRAVFDYSWQLLSPRNKLP